MTHTTLLFGWNSGVHGYTAKQRQWEPQGGVRARVPRQDMLVHVSSRGRPKERRCFLTRFPLFRAPSHPHVNSTLPCLLPLPLPLPLTSEKYKIQLFALIARTLSTWLISSEPFFKLHF